MNEKKRETVLFFGRLFRISVSLCVIHPDTNTQFGPVCFPKTVCGQFIVVVVVVITMYVEIRFFLVFTPLLDIETLQDHISISIYPMVHWYSLLLLPLILSVFFFIIKYSIFTSFLNYPIYIYIYITYTCHLIELLKNDTFSTHTSFL